MRHIILALLATGTFYPAYSVDDSAPLAHVVVTTPGKPVNIVAPVAKAAKYVSHATESAYDSLNPFAGDGVQIATTDNNEYPTGAVKPDYPGAKPRVLSGQPNFTTTSNVKTPAKPAPKYSMKPILAAAKDKPPADSVAEKKEPVKAAAKPKAKPVEIKKAKVKPVAVVKKKEVVKPKPAVKKPVAAKVVKAAEAPKPEVAPVKEIRSQVVKVEENEAAVAAVKEKTPEPRKEAAKVEAKEIPKAVKVEAVKSAAKGATKAEFSKEGDVEKLKFTFSQPTAAAVFERFGYYWLVFYSDDKIEMPDIKTSKIFDASKAIVPVKTAAINQGNSVTAPLVYKLELVKNAFAMAQTKDNTWEIDFDPGIEFKPEAPLKLVEKPEGWQIEAKGLSGQVTIKDDFTNDYIEVLPMAELGFNPEKTTTAKFVFEKTVQGVVIKPIGQVEIKSPEKGRLLISKEAPAPEKAETQVMKPNPQLKPIYPFKKWTLLKGDEYRKAESKIRTGNAVDFGKFLFEQGLYSESAVNLQGERGFEASFLTGASYYMLGRFEDALKIFDSLILPDGVDPNELLTWRAAADFELGQTNPVAAKTIDLNNFYLVKNLDNYPDEIRNRLVFSIAEKMIADGKYDDAQKLIDQMPKSVLETPSQSYTKYLQAKLYDGQNKKARAREIWAEVAKSATDRESQAKATYEIIIQDYNGGKIELKDAIDKINDIRILWRGDIFEYTMLSSLADMYVKNKQPYEALKTYKEILTSFPNFPHNLAIANTMRDIYTQVETNNFSDKEKTFGAVTIYYEFEELKPTGENGDQITLQLADALARYDLLGDSVKVLQKYATGLTDPAQKTEIATRIAILQFLDNKPKDALQSLQDSVAPNLPNYLIQERRILQVRCLIEVGDIDKAVSLLSSLPDEQANRFRADIYWKQKKWQELVDVYDLVADKSDDDIMRIAVGNVMIDDKKALQALNKKYHERMSKSAYADSFDYVTDVENVDFRNLSDSLKLDKTQNLMTKYRERIKDKGLAAVTGKKDAPPKPAEKSPVADKPPVDAKK